MTAITNLKKFGQFDFIIVGGGTAGCVLANRLSSDPTKTVLLLEAGKKDRWVWLHIPAGLIYCVGNPKVDWCYKSEPEEFLNSRTLAHPRGKVLGGSSSINGMVYMRGQKEDYDNWSKLCGDSRWSWQNVLPYFKRSESHWKGETEFHGASGEWSVSPHRMKWEIDQAFRAGAQEFGVDEIDDFNRGDNSGSSTLELNQRGGLRLSSAKAFLKPVRNRKNLTVLTEVQVKKVKCVDRTAMGVEFFKDNQEFFAEANQETILSAGAIGTPQLLLLSGIGPGQDLQNHGIGIVTDLAGVGGNLQDHLNLYLRYKVHNVDTLNTLYPSLWKRFLMGAEYAAFRRGPLSMSVVASIFFAKSDESQSRPNLQCHVLPFARPKADFNFYPFAAFTPTICNLRPTSRGSVRLRAADYRTPPAIINNYLSSSEDQDVAVKSLKKIRQIVMHSKSMEKYHPEELFPGSKVESYDELLKAAIEGANTVYHPVGTCKMGIENDLKSVVDSELRVKGIKKLRVIDASVMPVITSGNTSSPTIMIAERGSDLILKNK